MSNLLQVRFFAVVLAVLGFVPLLSAQTAKDGVKGTPGYERYRGDKNPYKPASKTTPSSSNSLDVSKERGGAEAIKNSYSREASFERKNNAFGGLFSNADKKAILKKRLENEMRGGTEPRSAMDSAFGDYIAKGISRYEDRGQKIVFDSSLTALDKALAIYRSTRGSDVPRLKEYMLNGRPMPDGTNDENILITEVHVYPDQLSRDQMLAQLGPAAYGKIYSEELKSRKANPVKHRVDVKTEDQATALRDLVVEMYGSSLNDIPQSYWPYVGYNYDKTPIERVERFKIVSDEDAQNLAQRMAALYGAKLENLPAKYSNLVTTNAAGNKELSIGQGQTLDLPSNDMSKNLTAFNLDGTFNLEFFSSSPAKQKLFPDPNWVVVEFPPQATQLFTADQASSTFYSDNGRFIKVYENLDRVSDLQLSWATAIHTSVSNFDELQARISRPVKDRMAKDAASMLSNLDMEVYQVCRECLGVEDSAPVKRAEAGKKVPAKKDLRTKR